MPQPPGTVGRSKVDAAGDQFSLYQDRPLPEMLVHLYEAIEVVLLYEEAIQEHGITLTDMEGNPLPPDWVSSIREDLTTTAFCIRNDYTDFIEMCARSSCLEKDLREGVRRDVEKLRRILEEEKEPTEEF